MLIITIMIIIMIAFKSAIQDFLQSPHFAVNCLQHVRSSGQGAILCKSCVTHQVLITCNMLCNVPCVHKDSSVSKFDRVETAFILALSYWLIH